MYYSNYIYGSVCLSIYPLVCLCLYSVYISFYLFIYSYASFIHMRYTPHNMQVPAARRRIVSRNTLLVFLKCTLHIPCMYMYMCSTCKTKKSYDRIPRPHSAYAYVQLPHLQDEEEFVEYANLESGWNSSVKYHDLSWPAGIFIHTF